MKAKSEAASGFDGPLGERLSAAFAYALALHATQKRKGSDIPYVAHLLAVTALAIEHGADEDEAIAAMLHDGPEDRGGLETLGEIERRFGERVAGIVRACSDTFEDPKPAWRPRKEAYIARIATADPSAVLVSASDKLHNARAILRDFRELGDRLWDRFSGGTDTLWYYRALCYAYRSSLAGERLRPLIDELDRVVSELEGLLESAHQSLDGDRSRA